MTLKYTKQMEHRRVGQSADVLRPSGWNFEWMWLRRPSSLPLYLPSFSSLITVLLSLGRQVILCLFFDNEKIMFHVVRKKSAGRQSMELRQEVRSDHLRVDIC